MLDAGAQSVGDARECHAVAVDARAPKFDGGIVTRLDCLSLGIVVNKHGRALLRRGRGLLAEALRHLGKRSWPGSRIRLRSRSSMPRRSASSCRRCFRRRRRTPSASLRRCWICRPTKLEATVDAFNRGGAPGIVRPRVLDDCRTVGLTPEKTHWAQRIDTPPFWGYPLRPGITFTYLGLKVDERAQVLMTRRRARAEHLRGRRDHGGEHPAQGVHRRRRHDHRHGVRPHRRRGGRAACRTLTRSRHGAARDDGLQCLPVLRAVLSRVSGDGRAA